MSYWAGVISRMCAATILFCCMMFSVIGQNNELKTEVKTKLKELSQKVSEHDEIMQAYAFYNWKMSFFEEDKK